MIIYLSGGETPGDDDQHNVMFSYYYVAQGGTQLRRLIRLERSRLKRRDLEAARQANLARLQTSVPKQKE